jgi:TolB-like protein
MCRRRLMFQSVKGIVPCVCALVFACFLLPLILAVPPASATTYDFDDGIRELVSELICKKGSLLRNKKIAVFGIVEQTGKEQWLITASIEDGILDALVDEGYNVVERSRIDDVLKRELKKSADQWFDESQVADVGKLLGADAVITGLYTMWGNNALRVSVGCISVSDGRVLAASRVNLHTDRIQNLLKRAEPRKQDRQDEIGRDGVYVAYANGVVRDTSTGLEWKVGPDRDMNWDEARSWVRSLGEDWQIPTLDELEGLYQEGKGDRNMTPLLKTTGWWVWSGEEMGSPFAFAFFFHDGLKGSAERGGSRAKRAFAVRSRSDG